MLYLNVFFLQKERKILHLCLAWTTLKLASNKLWTRIGALFQIVMRLSIRNWFALNSIIIHYFSVCPKKSRTACTLLHFSDGCWGHCVSFCILSYQFLEYLTNFNECSRLIIESIGVILVCIRAFLMSNKWFAVV